MTQTTEKHLATTRGRQTLVGTDRSRLIGNWLAVTGAAMSCAFARRQGRAGIACVDLQCRAFATGEDQ